MIATEKLLLISCLFQGIICNEFKAFMPQRIKALSGSCVLIPCTFTIEERLEKDMVEPARGIWMTSYNFRHIVFDSSRHYSENTLKAELLGKVTNKNCTTIIHHLKKSDSKSYFLRADPPKYTFAENVTLEVVDSPDRPAISPSSAVKEGALTSLACTAPAPCPREPPALVWSDTLDGSVEIEQVEQQDGTKAVSSVLTFTASHLHHNKDITCTAQYPVGSETKSAGKVSTLHVLYSPKNTLVLINPSGEIQEGDHVTLSCSSNANPAVSRYTWFKVKGDNINEKSAEQDLTFTDINPSDSGLYYCEARNEHGAENSTAVQLNVAYPPKNTLVLINPSGEIQEGDHVTLSCSSNANPAVSRYTWFEVKGDNINEKSAEQNLTFTDINPSDSGLYYCEARNEHGAENSTAVQLNVGCMPQISHESSCSKDDTESITCICVSRGSPSPITEWRIAGNKLENNTDRGSISNSKLEDHTMRSTLILLEPLAKNEAIQCLSKNRIGTASFQFHVFHEQKEAPATPCIYVVMGTAAVQMLATILVVFIMKRKRKAEHRGRENNPFGDLQLSNAGQNSKDDAEVTYTALNT